MKTACSSCPDLLNVLVHSIDGHCNGSSPRSRASSLAEGLIAKCILTLSPLLGRAKVQMSNRMRSEGRDANRPAFRHLQALAQDRAF